MSDAISDRPVTSDRLGRYRILGELGRGGMGVVYLAEDPTLERRVAIKVLPERVAADRGRIARFEREAKLLASLNHPNIATIYSLEVSASRRFLTMELIEGDTLADRLKRGPPPVEETILILRQIACGLQAAHEQGVIHRDLKPANVKITPAGLAKVLDFGLARPVESEPEGDSLTDLTVGGALLGTPGYMSPEQVTLDEVDHRTDIWAFGCLLFECLTGRRAFAGRNLPEVLRSTVERQLDWDVLPRGAPPGMRELLEACLAKRVSERVDSMAKVRRTLDGFLERQTLSTVITSRLERAQPPALAPVSAPNNLPVPLTSFIGRECQLDEIRRLLGAYRLVTLTGAGGCGKTRLALEIARRPLGPPPDGIWWVEFAPLARPELVAQTVASVLGLKEQQNRTLTETLLAHLSQKQVLLIFDNCEHLLETCAELAEVLLRACPKLRILTTSREALRIDGEFVYRVPSLELSDAERLPAVDQLAAVESLRLFAERARTLVHDFAITADNARQIADICRRLDGIPLAIELAVARLRTMSVGEIAGRLDDRFRLLTGGARTSVPRHKTLRALIDWSYEQLTDKEQVLLQRLSVFAGGWTLSGAESVGAGEGVQEWEVLDLLSRVIEKSLVEVETDDPGYQKETRYRMLETIRQYVRERLLAGGGAGAVRRRHLDFYLALVERVEPELSGADQVASLARLDAENANLRAALETCGASDGEEVEFGVRLAGLLGRYWEIRGYWSEARAVYADLLARPRGRERNEGRATALRWAGRLAECQGNYQEARALYEESLAIYREIGDRRGIAHLLNHFGNLSSQHGSYAEARSFYEESQAIYRELKDKRGIAVSLGNLATVVLHLGDHARARSLTEESAALKRELGDRRGIAQSLGMLGRLALSRGDYPAARSHYEERLAIAGDLGDLQLIARSRSDLGNVAFRQGDCPAARSHYEESLAVERELHDRYGTSVLLRNLGTVARDQGEYAEARRHYEESLAICREGGDRHGVAVSLYCLGALAGHQGDHTTARTLFGESLTMAREIGEKHGISSSLIGLGEVAMSKGDYAEARSFFEEGLAMQRELREVRETCALLRHLGAVARARGELGRAVRLVAAVEALTESGGSVPGDEARRELEDPLCTLREELGEKQFVREWASGLAMNLEQAIEYALGEAPASGGPDRVRQ